MDFTPLDIRKKEFRKVMRGCDPEEVEMFLEDVSEFVEGLLAEADKYASRMTELEQENATLKSQLESLNSEVESEAKGPDKEAELIIREAELKALEILEQNRAEANRLKEEITVLKQQKNSFIKRLKHLFAAQIDMIEVLEIEDVDMDELRAVNRKLDKRTTTSRRQIEKVPTFKRVARGGDPARDDSIDYTKLRADASGEPDLPFIKKKAKEILGDTKSTDVDADESDSNQLDLDDLLSNIGERNE